MDNNTHELAASVVSDHQLTQDTMSPACTVNGVESSRKEYKNMAVDNSSDPFLQELGLTNSTQYIHEYLGEMSASYMTSNQQTTVWVRVLQDCDCNCYLFARWDKAVGSIGQYKLDGPCSESDALEIFQRLAKQKLIPDSRSLTKKTTLVPSKRRFNQSSEQEIRTVSGYYLARRNNKFHFLHGGWV